MDVMEKNPQLRKPVGTYLKMTEEQRQREIELKQEIFRMDQYSRMKGAYSDGKKEGWEERDEQARHEKLESARKMKIRGYPVQEIVDITGLTVEEIERL